MMMSGDYDYRYDDNYLLMKIWWRWYWNYDDNGDEEDGWSVSSDGEDVMGIMNI